MVRAITLVPLGTGGAVVPMLHVGTSTDQYQVLPSAYINDGSNMNVVVPTVPGKIEVPTLPAGSTPHIIETLNTLNAGAAQPVTPAGGPVSQQDAPALATGAPNAATDTPNTAIQWAKANPLVAAGVVALVLFIGYKLLNKSK